MIYTITFNPAIDYILEVDKLEINEINRAKAERILAGGKGINVSIVLKNLGIDSIALGFLGGFTGQEIKRKIEKLGIKTDFVYIKNKSSRINVKLQTNAHGKIIEETAINSDGPEISEEEVNEEIGKMAEMYKMEADKLKELLGDRELEQMKKDMAVQKAVTLVADEAKEA